jgi:arginine/lysine/ornithine decarboxylase
LREHCKIDVGMSDHRRILATLSFADDARSAERLIDALWRWRKAATQFDEPAAVHLPSPDQMELETVMLPRDAFFAPTEMVPDHRAAGRIAAEQITPYPPGIPAVIPGERLTDAIIGYLRSGAEVGITLPDAADPTMRRFRVVR